MSVDFAEVTDITIPQGEVTKIEETATGRVLWEKKVEGFPVYAIGSKAKTWSNNAVPDAYGFYKLDMPDAIQLVRLSSSSFGAKIKNGSWYVCEVSSDLFDALRISSFTAPLPTELPISDIVNLSGGACVYNNITYRYMFYTTKDETYYMGKRTITSSGSTSYSYTKFSNVKLQQKIFSTGYAYVRENALFFNGSPAGGVMVDTDRIKSVCGEMLIQGAYYLTYGGELYKVTNNENTRIFPEAGKIIGCWITDGSSNSGIRMFIATETQGLYAKGYNYSYSLGLPLKENYNDFTKTYNGLVKKVTGNPNRSFLLTYDGDLYHTGLSQSGITDTHEVFTRIHPEHKYEDIEYIPEDNTLVVMIKE